MSGVCPSFVRRALLPACSVSVVLRSAGACGGCGTADNDNASSKRHREDARGDDYWRVVIDRPRPLDTRRRVPCAGGEMCTPQGDVAGSPSGCSVAVLVVSLAVALVAVDQVTRAIRVGRRWSAAVGDSSERCGNRAVLLVCVGRIGFGFRRRG